MRVTLLDAAGAPSAGSQSMVVTGDVIEMAYDPTVKAGSQLTQENGCGDTCVDYQGSAEITGVDLTSSLCAIDAELIELMTGASRVVVGGVTRGFAVPIGAQTREVSIEGWTKAWNGTEQELLGGLPAYWRWIFPRTKWTVGGATLGNSVLAFPLTGNGKSNSQFGDGPANDLPWDAYIAPMGIFLDDELPTPTCGYQTLVAS